MISLESGSTFTYGVGNGLDVGDGPGVKVGYGVNVGGVRKRVTVGLGGRDVPRCGAGLLVGVSGARRGPQASAAVMIKANRNSRF